MNNQGTGVVSKYEMAVKKCKKLYMKASILFGGMTVAYVAVAALLPLDIIGRIMTLINAMFTAIQTVIYLRLWRGKNQAEQGAWRCHQRGI
jgi:hypothetical protein